MALGCRDMLSECNGCGICMDSREICSDCKRPLALGEKYYRIRSRTLCELCVKMAEDEKCLLCRESSVGGIKYKNISLCTVCCGISTGYVGYI